MPEAGRRRQALAGALPSCRPGYAGRMIVAFDPGRNVGVAFVDESGALISSTVLGFAEAMGLELPPGAVIVVGNGTGGRELAEALIAGGLTPVMVEEEGTSLEARALYFRDHPPGPLGRLLPRGMRAPGRLVDDYAAYAIALRYLADRGPD